MRKCKACGEPLSAKIFSFDENVLIIDSINLFKSAGSMKYMWIYSCKYCHKQRSSSTNQYLSANDVTLSFEIVT